MAISELNDFLINHLHGVERFVLAVAVGATASSIASTISGYLSSKKLRQELDKEVAEIKFKIAGKTEEFEIAKKDAQRLINVLERRVKHQQISAHDDTPHPPIVAQR